MKATIEIDCTPKEARRAMGLPDLTPVHDRYVAMMMETMEQGVKPVIPCYNRAHVVADAVESVPRQDHPPEQEIVAGSSGRSGRWCGETVFDVGGFDPSLHDCNDWNFDVRAGAAGARFARIDDTVALYRTVAGSRLVRDVGIAETNARTIRSHPYCANLAHGPTDLVDAGRSVVRPPTRHLTLSRPAWALHLDLQLC